jgi:arginine decarboxylase
VVCARPEAARPARDRGDACIDLGALGAERTAWTSTLQALGVDPVALDAEHRSLAEAVEGLVGAADAGVRAGAVHERLGAADRLHRRGAARRQFQRDGEQLLGRAIDHALRLRAAIADLDGLDLMTDDVIGGPGAFALDPTHVTFDVTGLGLTGFSAADWLREHHGIHVELADHRRLMALITYADSDANVDRLIAALRTLTLEAHDADRSDIPEVPAPADLRMETVMLPRDAFLGATEMVPWRPAAGRVSAEMICPYPPGIPVVAPGERLTDTVVDYFEQLAAAGVMVEGAADETLEHLRVVTPR